MSSMLALLCVGWFGLAAAWSVQKPAPYALEDADLHFERFIQEFGRNYADEHEKLFRLQIFKGNFEKVNRLNEKSQHAVFDLSHEELKSKFSCFESSLDHDLDSDSGCKYLTDSDIKYNDAPESWDWREHDAVTPVKNQKRCGSGYAFSAIGTVESQYAIKHKELVRLSEQQIVDCDRYDNGCDIGYLSIAIRSVIKQGGSEAEADYPYTGQSGDCHFDAKKVKVHFTDCHSYNLTSQEKLKQLVYHNGPIGIAIKASSLTVYSHGIMDDPLCDEGMINHAVLLVGYASENDVPYWIVKNSWDTSFGENGYFRMHRGENFRSCGMMNEFMASAIVA